MKRPYLIAETAAQSLAWADKYSGYTKEDFDRVFCFDECTIGRGIGLRPESFFIAPKDQRVLAAKKIIIFQS